MDNKDITINNNSAVIMRREKIMNRKSIAPFIQSLSHNYGKTIIVDKGKSGGRKVVFRCANDQCCYVEVYHHLLLKSAEDHQQSSLLSRNCDTEDSAEEQEERDARLKEKRGCWQLEEAQSNNTHTQANGLPCAGVGAKVKQSELQATGGIINRIQRHMFLNQSSKLGRNNNSILLTQELLLAENVIASRDQIKKANKMLQDSYRKEEYMGMELRSYLTCFQDRNERCHFKIETLNDDGRTLERFCVLMPYAVEVYNKFAFKVVAMDGAHMKRIEPVVNNKKRKGTPSLFDGDDEGVVTTANNVDRINTEEEKSEKSTKGNVEVMIPLVLVMLCGLGPNNTRIVYGLRA